MKRLVILLVALMMVAVAVRPVSADQRAPGLDPVATWNGLVLDAVRTTRASDSDAARSYAMVNAAMYDAVNGIAARHGGRHRAYLLRSPQGAPPQGDQQAAAVAAAHAVLTLLYPGNADRYDQQLASDLAKLGDGPRVTAGRSWGKSVGDYVFDARAADGSRPVETRPAGSGPGVFPLAWSGAQYRGMVPFAVADAGRYVGSGPPALTSLDYAAAFAEVKVVGDARIDDPAKLAQFQYWSLPAGTDQPPGEWVKIALEVSTGRSLPDKARLLALLGVSLSDVSISTVRAKYVYRHWRPETAIQQADTDGNAYTDKDAGWKARAGSPGGNPEYVSGHSSFSGAGSAVLAGFFCADRIAFTHVTDSAPIDPTTGRPMQRNFASFSQAAQDAGRSRVVGGLHFEFSNQGGLTMGRDLAAEVLAKKLLYTTGPTHHGECPL